MPLRDLGQAVPAGAFGAIFTITLWRVMIEVSNLGARFSPWSDALSRWHG